MLFALTLILVYLGLGVVLWVLALFLQGLIYTESTEGLYWRAPAAAAGIWLVALLWPVLFNLLTEPEQGGLRWPASFSDMFVFSITRTDIEFEEFVVPASFNVSGKELTYYRQKNQPGVYESKESPPKALPKTAELVGVTKDENGNRKEIRLKRTTDARERVSYVNEEEGLVMADEEFGRINSSRYSQLFLNVFAVLLTWGAWFVALWLLLRFQWPHALGLSIPCLLVWGFALNLVL